MHRDIKEDNNGTIIHRKAKEALSLAVGMAESLNHGYVGTEHLLIGLLQEGTGRLQQGLRGKWVEESKVVELVSQLNLPKYFCTDGRKCSLYPKSPQVIETVIGKQYALRQHRSVQNTF